MTIVLLVIGLLATAGGFVTIGFGIPINAFSLGNTLILSGSIAVAAGLILISLAAIHGRLRRIQATLEGHAPSRAGRSAESVESMAPPTARMTPASPPIPTRAPMASKPEFRPEADLPPLPEMFSADAPQAVEPPRMSEPPRMPEPPRLPEPPRMPEPQRNVEPRFPVAPASAPAPAAGPLDWLRSKSKPAPAAPMPTPPMPVRPAAMEPPRSVAMEAPVVDVPDEAPLSPRPPQRPSMMPPVSEPSFDPTKTWSPGRPEAPAEMAPRAEQPMPRPTPQPEPPKDGFDLVWPDRSDPAGSPVSEAAKREPALDMPLPPVPARPRDAKPADRRPPGPAKMAGERGPAILKSGVIDGMPYTLYADGSIEAELPQGTVKFSSVDALRSHLEKQA